MGSSAGRRVPPPARGVRVAQGYGWRGGGGGSRGGGGGLWLRDEGSRFLAALGMTVVLHPSSLPEGEGLSRLPEEVRLHNAPQILAIRPE